ncbi:MAG: glucosaminidase domain-containing protein [Puniceicoccales bacterium]|jgi:hypothetical protein|nr:glucosaminidase domain-containing protein [Puniceicoccales bacterium]
MDPTSHVLYLSHPSSISEIQGVHFLLRNNPKLTRDYAERILRIYGEECRKESINLAIAVAQMALETSFLRFGGEVKGQQNNFAGLGSTPNARSSSFPTAEEGIRAHVQHLKAYASTEPLASPCVDPRRKFVEKSPHFGKLKTVHDLAGTWAMDKNYGKKLEKLIQQLMDSPPTVE